MANGHGGYRPGGGRKKGSIDPVKANVIAIFKEASPRLLQLAIKRAEGYEIEVDGQVVKVPGDNAILRELIKKALPDNLNLGIDTNTVNDFIQAILTHRPPGAAGD